MAGPRNFPGQKAIPQSRRPLVQQQQCVILCCRRQRDTDFSEGAGGVVRRRPKGFDFCERLRT